jgi:HK97 gp10 family phage protein
MALEMDVVYRGSEAQALAAIEEKFREGLAEYGTVLLPKAQALVPEDSGDLKATIRYAVAKKKLYAALRAGSRATKKKTGVDYAAYVEYGTQKMPARPFMRGAVLQTQDSCDRIMAAKLGSLK